MRFIIIPFGYIVNDYAAPLYLIGCTASRRAFNYTLSGIRAKGTVHLATVVCLPQRLYDESDNLPETDHRWTVNDKKLSHTCG